MADVDAEIIAGRINAYLTASVAHGFSGAVLVARDGEVLLSQGFGLGDRARAVPVATNTIFNIGAISQTFTVLALLKLVEEGKLALSDTLGDIFPAIPPDKQDISIQQLLSHSAGISPRVGGYRYDFVTRGQFLSELFLSRFNGVAGDPAGASYTLMAVIVEIISGIAFEEYLATRLLQPAGMKDTGYLLPDWNPDRFAHAYFYDIYTREWQDWGITIDQFMTDGVSWYGLGRGDMQSTIDDLFNFHQALQSGALLDPALLALMEAPLGFVSPGSAQSYGWNIESTSRGTKLLSKRGSNGYFFADYLSYPEENAVVILLTNLIRDENLTRNVSGLLFDPDFVTSVYPKDRYELVIDFIESHVPEQVSMLPAYFESIQQDKLDDPSILNPIGLQLMNRGDLDWAVAILALNVQLFPLEGNFWDSLGEAYLANSQNDLAAESFMESLRLAPPDRCFWCTNALRTLEGLGYDRNAMQELRGLNRKIQAP